MLRGLRPSRHGCPRSEGLRHECLCRGGVSPRAAAAPAGGCGGRGRRAVGARDRAGDPYPLPRAPGDPGRPVRGGSRAARSERATTGPGTGGEGERARRAAACDAGRSRRVRAAAPSPLRAVLASRREGGGDGPRGRRTPGLRATRGSRSSARRARSAPGSPTAPGVWFVREGDALPGGARIAAIAGSPPGVRVTGSRETHVPETLGPEKGEATAAAVPGAAGRRPVKWQGRLRARFQQSSAAGRWRGHVHNSGLRAGADRPPGRRLADPRVRDGRPLPAHLRRLRRRTLPDRRGLRARRPSAPRPGGAAPGRRHPRRAHRGERATLEEIAALWRAAGTPVPGSGGAADGRRRRGAAPRAHYWRTRRRRARATSSSSRDSGACRVYCIVNDRKLPLAAAADCRGRPPV